MPPTPKKGKGYLLKHLVDVQNPYPCLQFSLPFQTQPKPYYRPDSSAFYRHTRFTPDMPKFNSKVHKPYPMSTQHGSKTIFFSATHTDTARIRGCTPLPRVSPYYSPLRFLQLSFIPVLSSSSCMLWPPLINQLTWKLPSGFDFTSIG